MNTLKNVKYIWLTVCDGSGIKIYQQKRKVKYAVHEVKGVRE